VLRQRETLGRVGIISLSEARAEAKRKLAEYTLGKHKVSSKPWSDALDEYLAGVKQKRKPRTYVDYDRILKSHFKFGQTKFADIMHDQLQKKLDKIADRPTEQHHAYAVLRAFVRWAHDRNYVDRNPMERMRSPEKYASRERILSDDELAKVWKAARGTYGRIVKLLILTGQRRGEIVAYDPAWKHKDTITLPSWLTKNSHTHTFPIGPLTEALLGDNQWKGWSKAKTQLDDRAGVHDWTLHDLRRTLRSKWAELGIIREVAEKYINHISGVHSGVEGIYDRYKYMPEMRKAVELWERHVQTLIAGCPAT
jgi:integrase